MRIGRILAWLATGVALAVAAGALLPLELWPLDSSVDLSFGTTLHLSAAHRLADGPRLISTYGPLGFVFYTLYLPETFAWLVGLRVLLAAITCWVLAWIGSTALRSPWGAALAIVAVGPLLVAPDVWFLIVPMLALLIELLPSGGAPSALRVALGAAIGLACLIKVTFLIAALAVLVPLILTSVAGRRRLPLTALAAAAAGATTWIAMGMSWADWLAYLDWSLREVSPGYSRAMQHPTSTVLVAHAAAVSAAAVVAGAILARRRLGRGWWMTTAGLAGVHFLMFKAGFVRADTHVFITAAGLLVVGALLVILLGPPLRRLSGGALLVALLGGGLWWHATRVCGAPDFIFRPILPMEALQRLATVPDLLSGAGARAHELDLAEMRQQIPIEPLQGPGDIFPYAQNLLLAHGLELRPRPVFQSYMAYTPRLAQANADYLSGAWAPLWILFEVAPIDGRFPALEDAAAWPILLTHYRLAGVVAERFALLRRRSAPLTWRLDPIGSLQASTETAVPVPAADAGPVWVRIDLRETPGDRLATTLLAAPLVFMDVTLDDASTCRYRLLPAVARGGFLFSPLVGSTDDFLYFIRRDPRFIRRPAITEFTLHIEPPLGIASQPRQVEVEFSRLVVESEPPGR